MNKVIVLDGRDFIVVDNVSIDEQNYLYVVATDGTNDISILNEYIQNGDTLVKSVTDGEIIKEVFNRIAERIV